MANSRPFESTYRVVLSALDLFAKHFLRQLLERLGEQFLQWSKRTFVSQLKRCPGDNSKQRITAAQRTVPVILRRMYGR